ncbi:hypothetical protein [uncultured Nostoc sp.]|uniref:NACHT C-terminal helical domain 2-containing protein n=1 Tax=uncultured Nostoc sp. TaxID=340711 RepID=UPI0035CC7809
MLKRFMMGRSLSCSPEGIQKAKRALIRCSLTQKALAEKLEVTRQPIGKFFRGKPVDRNIFVKICGELSLDWEEVIPKPTIAALVQEVREKIKPRIQEHSEKVLKSIETQHGLIVERAKKIYSFCHLTIHEYFTAREIVVVKHSSDEALQSLVKQITNKRWREIFLLAVGMSPNADQLLLLMKEKIDNLVANNKKLQDLLTWIYNKAATVRVPYKSVVVRAFYLERLIDLHLATIDIRLAIFFAPDDAKNEDFGIDAAFNAVLIHTLETKLYSNTPLYKEYNDFGSNLDLVLEPQLAKYLNLNLTISPQSLHEVAENCLNFVRKLYQPLENILKHQIKLELKVAVQELKDELPEKCTGNEIFKKWWQENGKDWTTRLRNLMIEYRKIGHDWQFTSQELETLKSYYNTNKLLVNCLNSDCYVSREVRQQIEDTLLLPIAEIKQHQQQS